MLMLCNNNTNSKKINKITNPPYYIMKFNLIYSDNNDAGDDFEGHRVAVKRDT